MRARLTGELRKFRDLRELSSAAAQDISVLINKVVRLKGVFHLALSGGNTPRTLYHILGTTYAKTIPWNAVHVFFCDERFVPHDDGLSNFRMAKEELLDCISIPRENIHPISTGNFEMNTAARDYEIELRRFISETAYSFDLAVLGMGRDGHTASLFPGSTALEEKEKWAIGVEVNAVPAQRITLTYPILNRAAVIYLFVSGADKASILTKVLGSANEFRSFPAAGIDSMNGKLVWWVDAGAWPHQVSGK